MTRSRRQDADVEVEWQLDAIDLRPVQRWFAARSDEGGLLSSVPGLAAVPRTVKRQLDAYLDTDDWRLARSGYVLRTRASGGAFEATLKDLVPAEAGIRRRLEVNEEIASADTSGLDDDGPVGRRIRALVGNRRLHQVLEVRTRRRPYSLEVHGTCVGEVALDDTVILAGGERHRIRLQRVEVEVQPAWVEALSPLVERLRLDCGLQPATLSKFEAGLLGAGYVVPRIADLGPTRVDESSTISDLAFAVLRKDFGSMLTHEAGTRLGEDIESLHQMRVSTRRMRAALSLFEGVLPARAARVNEELGWIAGVLGTVRDLDIQLENLEGWTYDLPGVHRQALDDLGDLLTAHRHRGRQALLEALESRRYERLVASMRSMLEETSGRRSAAAGQLALVALPDLVHIRHRQADKAAKRARASGEVANFHRLRIRCKRLRYAIEFTGDLFPADVKRYAKQVASLQDALGLVQDAQAAAEQLQEIALGPEGADLPRATVFAMGMVAQGCVAEAAGRLEVLPSTKRLLDGKLWEKAFGIMQERAEAARLRASEEPAAGSRRPGTARPVVPALPVVPPLPLAAVLPVVSAGEDAAAALVAEPEKPEKRVTPIRRSAAPG